MKVKAVEGRLLVKESPREERTASGLYIPVTQNTDSVRYGVVVEGSDLKDALAAERCPVGTQVAFATNENVYQVRGVEEILWVMDPWSILCVYEG